MMVQSSLVTCFSDGCGGAIIPADHVDGELIASPAKMTLGALSKEERQRVKINMERRLKNLPFDDHEYLGLKKDGTKFPLTQHFKH